jgi:predicted RNA-binding protein with PIN domain
MTIFIDGYNILKYLSEGPVTDRERARFIAQLNRYVRIKGHAITVVFDGGFSDVSYQEAVGSVSVIYSGVRMTADQVILDMISSMAGNQILLVSNDRALITAASKLGAIAMNVGHFYSYVLSALRNAGAKRTLVSSVVKTTKTKNSDLDELMKSASAPAREKKEDRATEVQLIPESKEAKMDRRLLKVLNKL